MLHSKSYIQSIFTSDRFWKISALIGLIFLAVGERLWLDLGPNVELVTTVTLVSAFYLGKHSAWIITLVVLAITDIFLGNSMIMLFTWSAYLIIAFVAYFLKRFTTTPGKRIGLATLGGAISSLWFYLWTNFGVWLLDSYGMYTRDVFGLVHSYIMGLPFLKNQLLSNLFFIPIAFVIIELSRMIIKSLKTDKHRIVISS